MSNTHHAMHAANDLLKHTSAGKQISGAAVAGVVGAAKVVGGTALAGMAAAAAPIVVPVALVAGIGYLVSKQQKNKH